MINPPLACARVPAALLGAQGTRRKSNPRYSNRRSGGRCTLRGTRRIRTSRSHSPRLQKGISVSKRQAQYENPFRNSGQPETL